MSIDDICSETKIDRIESRLASIEQLLRQSSNASSSDSAQQTPDSLQPSNMPSSYAPHLEDSSNAQTPATGGIGLQVESMAAKNVLEQTIARDYAVQHDPQLILALESLRGIVYRTQLDVSSASRGLSNASLAKSALEAPLPGWEQVKLVLDRAESEFAPIGRPPRYMIIDVLFRRYNHETAITCVI